MSRSTLHISLCILLLVHAGDAGGQVRDQASVTTTIRASVAPRFKISLGSAGPRISAAHAPPAYRFNIIRVSAQPAREAPSRGQSAQLFLIAPE